MAKFGTNKPLFDYDGEDFYRQIRELAMKGCSDTQIGVMLTNESGNHLGMSTFSSMKNGKYERWSDEENKRRSAKIVEVLAQARQTINTAMRATYIQMALGKVKTKAVTTTTRHLVVNGEQTEDELVQTSETVQEHAPNMQAIATWLYHHDEEWRKVHDGDIDEDMPTNVTEGVDIDSWIKKELAEVNNKVSGSNDFSEETQN